jgi:hypothetical protein
MPGPPWPDLWTYLSGARPICIGKGKAELAFRCRLR